MKKNVYVSPDICVMSIASASILAGSGTDVNTVTGNDGNNISLGIVTGSADKGSDGEGYEAEEAF